MKKILITGGTVFVSRYIAEYYVKKGYGVYVINRNSREQSAGVHLIEADRHDLGDKLREIHFDVVIDTGYNSEDVRLLLNALGSYDDYIFISSSAVYPEYCKMPFTEDTSLGFNRYWKEYGTNKISAEETLQKINPNAYILRPPYLYGSMNNVYREAFVFECALNNRKFYLPKNDSMMLQFFHVYDLCRFADIVLQKKPDRHIFNVGNRKLISVREWVEICYNIAGKSAEFVKVYDDIEQRNYFSFYNYEYCLDVSEQYKLMTDTMPLYDGLKDSFEWYKNNPDKVIRKPFLEYIDNNLI